MAEYNDFYGYNSAQYGQIYEKTEEKIGDADTTTPDDEIEKQKRLQIAEHNAKAATAHFASLFGSKDFGESAMVGFRPAWYDLQQILLEEYKHKTPIKESAMNEIAPRLRNAATILLFAERLVKGLEKLEADAEMIATVKEGFEVLLEKASAQKLNLPEYHKTKKEIAKFKKPAQFLDLCNVLFK